MLKYLIVPPPPIAENIHIGSSNLMRARLWSGCSALIGVCANSFAFNIIYKNRNLWNGWK